MILRQFHGTFSRWDLLKSLEPGSHMSLPKNRRISCFPLLLKTLLNTTEPMATIPELVFVHLDWSSGTRSVVKVEIATFDTGKPISNSSLCYSVLSIYSTNILGNFTRFLTSIKSEKEVSKMLFFIDLTIHLTVLKNEKK